eukprot:CAMPEP_0170483622 /NCGR_PEP_ID=MMETSP0208-20121228/3286_1 /TAXON_ID=197538 /ORGANISM="Strombidium inclinatum, Strain S3" /LENGTH=56 /DNA_ID=CAMNT_0010756741 /DNA_START=183 /DNA_END=353 /DNA_ORIENTATION=+
MYDVSNEESFENIIPWMNDADQPATSKDVQRIIVGNKTDLKDERVISVEQRELLGQ